MSGLVCLQGGGEFSTGCRPMDLEVLHRARARRVVVVALAAAPGHEHRTAAANGVAHYRGLGADAVAAPDARDDADATQKVLSSADLVVLPGGSPSRLLTALRETPVGALLADLVDSGVAVSGASAGAMVLCGWTVLPDRAGPTRPSVAPGLGLVDGAVVVPHWSGGRGDWLDAIAAAVPAGTAVLGLPEESGVLVHDGVLTAVGRHPTRLLHRQRDVLPGEQGTMSVTERSVTDRTTRRPT